MRPAVIVSYSLAIFLQSYLCHSVQQRTIFNPLCFLRLFKFCFEPLPAVIFVYVLETGDETLISSMKCANGRSMRNKKQKTKMFGLQYLYKVEKDRTGRLHPCIIVLKIPVLLSAEQVNNDSLSTRLRHPKHYHNHE